MWPFNLCCEGTYSSDGASSCTTCPAGQACTVNGTVTDCPAGTYNAAGETTCTTCASGWFINHEMRS